jgi:hypothetical protein
MDCSSFSPGRLNGAQNADDLRFLTSDREIQSRFAGESWCTRPAQFRVGARSNQCPDHLDMAVDRGQHERAQTIFRREIEPRIALDEPLDDGLAAGDGSKHQRRLSMLVTRVNVSSGGKEALQHVDPAETDGVLPFVRHIVGIGPSADRRTGSASDPAMEFNPSSMRVLFTAFYLLMLWFGVRHLHRGMQTGVLRGTYGFTVRRRTHPARFRRAVIANIVLIALYVLLGIAAAVEYSSSR